MEAEAPAAPAVSSTETTQEQDIALQAWRLIKDLEHPKAFEEFIRMFPTAPQSYLARLKLIALGSSVSEAPLAKSPQNLPTKTINNSRSKHDESIEKCSQIQDFMKMRRCMELVFSKDPISTVSSENSEVLQGEATKKRLLQTNE